MRKNTTILDIFVLIKLTRQGEEQETFCSYCFTVFEIFIANIYEGYVLISIRYNYHLF